MEQQMSVVPCCAICGTKQQLMQCDKCKSVHYCSIAHQRIHLSQHEQFCRTLARQKENNKILPNIPISMQKNEFVSNTQQQIQPSEFDGSSSLETDELDCMASVQKIFKHPAAVLNDNSQKYSTEANSLTMEQMHMGGNSNSGHNIDTSCTVPQQWPLADLRLQAQNNQMNIIQQHATHEEQAQHYHHQHMQQQQQFVFYNNQNGQTDRNNSYQIGQGNENAIGNTNERRYDELCRNIINDMNQYGLSVVDDFLGNEKGLDVLHEVHRMYSAGVFKDGQLANNSKTDKDLRTIRGDKITWVKGVEPGCATVGYLINQIDAVICRANTMKNNGNLGNYNIKERTKAMVACYPGSGSHYVMHVDNPNKDGRVITAIYYLNVNWDTKRSGGVLRIFPEHGNSIADIEPKFDRLIFFWSDKRNPHEVQPAHRTRYAITVWYFDANEREAALNRCKFENHVNNTNSTQQTSTTKTTKTTPPAVPATAATKKSSTIAMQQLQTAAAAATQSSAVTNANVHFKNSFIPATTTTTTTTTPATTNTSNITKLSSLTSIPSHTSITTTT